MTSKPTRILGVIHHPQTLPQLFAFFQKEITQGRLKPGTRVGIELAEKEFEQIMKGKVPAAKALNTEHGKLEFGIHPTIASYWHQLAVELKQGGIEIVPILPKNIFERESQFLKARIKKAKSREDVEQTVFGERELFSVGTQEKAMIERIPKLNLDYAVIGENHAPEVVKALTAKGHSVTNPFQQKYPRAYARQESHKIRNQKLENARQWYKERKKYKKSKTIIKR
ncbi:MAG: hypothetical protein Q7S92_04790 [Candidatus Diapherotrites archaeon]|nr:hypothetical protein [Candidatus Diapherotrites archaeon]